MKRVLLQFGIGLGIVNFAVFFACAIYFRGDAINGREVNGHYFLASHGHLTEVSRNIFTYSKWHARSVWLTHPLAILCAWLLSTARKNPG